jgi:hypothetical protein
MAERKRILVLAATANETDRLREAADKLALEFVLGCSDDSGTLRLNFATRDSALHIVEFVRQNPVAAIIPAGDEMGPSAARAASMIGLPFHPPKAADACANKELLRRKFEATGILVSDDATTTLECVMTNGKLRVLAAAQSFSAPTTFKTLLPDVQTNAVELLKKLAAMLRLKHGPLGVEFSADSGRLSVAAVSLCYRQTALTDALHFRIPLVDENVPYAEVVIRNALDLDTSRIHLDAK